MYTRRWSDGTGRRFEFPERTIVLLGLSPAEDSRQQKLLMKIPNPVKRGSSEGRLTGRERGLPYHISKVGT